MQHRRRYYDLNTFLRERFGHRVQKVTVDAGFTCPNRDGTVGTGGCIYCNERGSGTGAHSAGIGVGEQVRSGIASMSPRYKAKAYLAYFQAFTNTYGDIATLKSCYDEALAVDGVVGLAIGTRPDCVGEDVLDMLSSYAERCMVWVEFGVQSMNPATLERINRSHGPETVIEAVNAAHERGILVCVHIVHGLPGESRTDTQNTVSTLSQLPIDGVKIHSLYVAKGTALARAHEKGQYRCLTRDEYVEMVVDSLERLPPRVVVQRLTGDPHRHELIAPDWTLSKGEVLSGIEKLLVARDTWQGKLFVGAQ